MTILDAIVQSLNRAGEYNRDDQVAPAVILWPDKDCQWEPVLPVLRERLPHLLTLGPYSADAKTGPAIWLRCMISRALPEANWPEKTTPILYLPGISSARRNRGRGGRLRSERPGFARNPSGSRDVSGKAKTCHRFRFFLIINDLRGTT